MCMHVSMFIQVCDVCVYMETRGGWCQSSQFCSTWIFLFLDGGLGNWSSPIWLGCVTDELGSHMSLFSCVWPFKHGFWGSSPVSSCLHGRHLPIKPSPDILLYNIIQFNDMDLSFNKSHISLSHSLFQNILISLKNKKVGFSYFGLFWILIFGSGFSFLSFHFVSALFFLILIIFVFFFILHWSWYRLTNFY